MLQEEHIRQLLANTAEDFGPTPDLTPTALRQGKRSLRLARLRTGAVATAAAAAVLTPALVVVPWWDSASDAAAQYSVSMPLHPASWPIDSPLAPPTTTYPVVHRPASVTDYELPELTREQREVQYAYKQKAADVLQQLLPPELGGMQVPDELVGTLLAATERSVYVINMGVVPADRPPVEPTPSSDVLIGRLPDGTPVVVTRIQRAVDKDGNTLPNATANMSAIFTYKGRDVSITVSETTVNPTGFPLTSERLLDVVTDARFLELVDFRIANPYLMDEGFGPHVSASPTTGQTTG